MKKGLQKLKACKIKEPAQYEVEINFKECVRAYRASFYPGVEQIDARTVRYIAKDAHEMMTTRMYIL